MDSFNRFAPTLQEVDVESPPEDHLGDYVEHLSPYEAAVATQRQTMPEPERTHADPVEVEQDFGRFAAQPAKQGTQVRQIAADSWFPNDFILNVGVNQVILAEEDPTRLSLQVWNHTNAPVYISPNPNAAPGWGSMVIPPRSTNGASGYVEVRTTDKMYLFTTSDYDNSAADLKQVSILATRYTG